MFTLERALEDLCYAYNDQGGSYSQFTCRREDGMHNSYICHFEGVEAYMVLNSELPNIIVEKSFFESVDFCKYGEHLVQAKYVEDEKSEDRNLGKLELRYRLGFKFKDSFVRLLKGPSAP